jgi:tryptophan-rich sensory protein
MMTDQTRDHRGLWRKALLTVPLIVAAGSLIGILSNSGDANGWYAQLQKPSFQPPNWSFGVVWTTLYAMMGIALAAILNARPSRQRNVALGWFALQLLLNFAWSPIFFGQGLIDVGLLVILAMNVLVTMTIIAFWKIRPLAGALLIPYLAWLCVATALNHEIGRLNPGADTAPLGITGA